MSERWPPPADLRPWLDATLSDCPCGREHRIALKRVLVGEGALEGLPELLPSPSCLGAPVLLLADPDTHEAAGRGAARALRAAGHRVEEALTGPTPHADDRTLEDLRPSLACGPGASVAREAGYRSSASFNTRSAGVTRGVDPS